MALLADAVVETASNPGTNTIVNLAGVAPGAFNTWASRFSTGARVYYGISDEISQREEGLGTFTSGSPNTISRDTVISNTSGNTSRLNFTGAVYVYNPLPASKALVLDQSGNLAITGGFSVIGGGGIGFTKLEIGDSSHPGYLGLYNSAGVRVGYVGFMKSSGGVLQLETENGFIGWQVTGSLEVDGLLTALASMNLTGNLNVTGAAITGSTIAAGGQISAIGNITANGVSSRLRAGAGARGSGDANAATLLGDFFRSTNAASFFEELPDGTIIQGDTVTLALPSFVTLPSAFPNACLQVIACEAAPQGWAGVSPTIYGTQQLSAAQFALYGVQWNGASWAPATLSARYLAIGY